MSGAPIVEEELIDRYLLDQLSESDRAQFEIKLLDDPELYREVQRRNALIQELKNSDLSTSFKKTEQGVKSVPVRHPGFKQWIRQPLSMAASVILVAGSILYATLPNSDNGLAPASDILRVGSSGILQTLRGDNTGISLDGTPPILLTIDAGPAPSDTYSFHLVNNETGETSLSEPDLSVDEDGWVRIIINRRLQGSYRADLRQSATGSVISYQLNFSN